MIQKLALTTATLIVASAVQASVAFDNFGPGDAYNTGTGMTIGQGYEQGCQFTSATTGTLSTITLAIGKVTDPGNVKLNLYADNNNTLGALLGTWSVTLLPNFGGNYAPKIVTNTNGAINLSAGSRYWLEACPETTSNYAAWNINSTGAQSLVSVKSANNTYIGMGQTGAMRIETVPEPASLSALALGSLALRRKFKKA